MIEKSEKSDTDSSSSSGSGTGSRSRRRGAMKVNVMYRGKLYRVRGVKVLVSVVTAVILLLVAIVGLGVWMLVSAYGEEKATASPSGANSTMPSSGTTDASQEESTPFTIDFNAPSATLYEASFPTLVANTHASEHTPASTESPVSEPPPVRESLPDDAADVSGAVGHFQGVTPRKNISSTSSRSPAPDPILGIFSGVPDLQEEDTASVEAPELPAGDSFIEYSENRPVIVLPSRSDNVDTGGVPAAYEVNTNPWVEQGEPNASPRYPLQGGLPDNIPRDIDPVLLDMGLPFPYPPSLATRAPLPSSTSPLPRHPTRPRYRLPEATHRGQVPEPYEDHYNPDFPPRGEEPQGHEANLRPYTAAPRSPDEQPTPSRTQENIFPRPGGLNYPELERFIPSEGSHVSAGFTLPAGVTLPPGLSMPVDVASAGDFMGLREAAEEHLKLRSRGPGSLTEAAKEHVKIRPLGPGSYLEDMMYYYNKHERKRPSTAASPPPTRSSTRYSQRTGLTEEGAAEYLGPPVVGYGDRPYRKHPGGRRPTDPGFQYYWDMYGHDGSTPAEHDDRGPVPEETGRVPGRGAPPPGSRFPMGEYRPPPHEHRQPHAHETRVGPSPPEGHTPLHPPPMVRGGQPHPVRPDAERPPVLHPAQRPAPPRQIHHPSQRPTPPRQTQHPSQRPASPRLTQHPSQRPAPPRLTQHPSQHQHHTQQHHAQLSPDRRLWVGPGPPPSEVPTSSFPGAPSLRPGPSPPPNHRPFLGPLYDMYEYSKKLATTLLNFPTGSDGHYNSSREEYMMKEKEILEDYNRVFQNPNTTSADVLPDMFDDRPSRNERVMLLDSSKLNSLSPFEMSLVTWTFLDFWEFLIEQVGTLSQEDLDLLEQKLERMRVKKDRVMARSLMTATVNHQVAQETGRGLQDSTRTMALAEELLKLLEKETEEEEKEAKEEKEGEEEEEKAGEDEETGRMWDPLGMFESNQKVKFMEFAIKVLFRFGRVYLKKTYALDCMMLLFCKDLNADSRKPGMDGTSAKIKR